MELNFELRSSSLHRQEYSWVIPSLLSTVFPTTSRALSVSNERRFLFFFFSWRIFCIFNGRRQICNPSLSFSTPLVFHLYFLQTTFIEHTHQELPLLTTRSTRRGDEAGEMKQEQARFFFCLVKITPSNFFLCRHDLLRPLPEKRRRKKKFIPVYLLE